MEPKLFLTLGLLLLIGVDARLQVTPMTFVPGLTLDLHIRCDLGQMSQTVSSVLVIQLEKEEGGNVAALVTLQAGSGVKVMPSHLKDRIVANGQLDNNNLHNSYVEMTLKEPTSTDQGHYACIVTALDMSGVLTTKTFTSQIDVDLSLNATVTRTYIQKLQQQVKDLENEQKQTNATLTDLLYQFGNITSRLSTCESEIKTFISHVGNTQQAQSVLDARVSSLETDKNVCCDLAGTLRNHSYEEHLSLKSDLNSLSSQCPDKCNARINDVEANMTSLSHVEPQIAFSARYISTSPSDQTNVPLRGVIKFEDVLVNEGNGYNPQTGVFTTPVTGTYMLVINFPLQDTDAQRVMYASLILDHHLTIGQIESGQSKGMHPSSLSLIFNLRAAQKVTVEAYESTSSSSTAPLRVGRHSAVFAGFLLYV